MNASNEICWSGASRTDCTLGKKSAFTLVELLVSLVVIAVLASLLLPALARSKSSARRIQCQSNLRQIGYASRMYSDDYNDFLVPAVISNYFATVNWLGNGATPGWDPALLYGIHIGSENKFLNAYLANPLTHDSVMKIAGCPEDKDGPNAPFSNLGAYTAVGTSYVSSHYPQDNDLKPPMSGALSSITRKASLVSPQLVLGGEFFTGACIQGLDLSTVYPSPPFAPWFHHVPNKYMIARVDGSTDFITLKTGQKSGPGFTYDESTNGTRIP